MLLAGCSLLAASRGMKMGMAIVRLYNTHCLQYNMCISSRVFKRYTLKQVSWKQKLPSLKQLLLN